MIYVGLTDKAEKGLAILLLKYKGDTAEQIVESSIYQSLTHEEKHSLDWDHDDEEEELREELERKLDAIDEEIRLQLKEP